MLSIMTFLVFACLVMSSRMLIFGCEILCQPDQRCWLTAPCSRGRRRDMPLGYLCCRQRFSGEVGLELGEPEGRRCWWLIFRAHEFLTCLCIVSPVDSAVFLRLTATPDLVAQGRGETWRWLSCFSCRSPTFPWWVPGAPLLLLVSTPLMSFIILKIYLTVLGLHCSSWAFSSCDEWGLL